MAQGCVPKAHLRMPCDCTLHCFARPVRKPLQEPAIGQHHSSPAPGRIPLKDDDSSLAGRLSTFRVLGGLEGRGEGGRVGAHCATGTK